MQARLVSLRVFSFRLRAGNSARKSMILTAVVFLVSAIGGLCQTTSSLSGIVKDPSGAVVGQALITLTETKTAQQRNTIANEHGAYSCNTIAAVVYAFQASGAD